MRETHPDTSLSSFSRIIVDVSLVQNFDDIIMSLVTLFNAATTEGWVDLMYMCMDIGGTVSLPSAAPLLPTLCPAQLSTHRGRMVETGREKHRES